MSKLNFLPIKKSGWTFAERQKSGILIEGIPFLSVRLPLCFELFLLGRKRLTETQENYGNFV